MNTKLIFIALLFLASCAHRKTDRGASPAVAEPMTAKEQKAKAIGKTRAIFHVIAPLGIELILFNIESKQEEKILMDKTLSQIALIPGHWQVTGFIMNERRYKLMNTSGQFVFHLKPNDATYVGSYIFQCPKVNEIHLAQMKKMSFFNRYPYSTEQRLCEMVVGSDFDNVKKVWFKMGSLKQVPLKLGF